MSKIDEILYDALEKKDAPSAELNRRILEKAKAEDKIMAFGKRKVAAAAAIALCITLAGGTGYAAYRYMTARQVVKELGSQELSEYFKDTDVVATKEAGKYRFRYLGNASAKLKDAFLSQEDKDTTYVALAVDRLDGKAMKEEEFVASPLIQGLNPQQYNVYTMGGGATWKVKNGVLYMIMSVDSIEMFADREVYLAITDGPDYVAGYEFDEASGKISPKDEFEGLNVLFTMEMDESKADTKAQEDYLKNFGQASEEEDEQEFAVKAKDADLQAFRELDFASMDTETIDKIAEKGDCFDTYEFEADDEGIFHVNVENKYLSAGGTFTKKFYEEGEATFVEAHYAEDEEVVIMQYDLVDNEGILHEKYIKFSPKQVKDIFGLIR
ncbi:MAG: hypothetical protein E7280_06200 [Lachnospiraceae bacterium]|nr:hypothetical protein [Lachnospiraceae bacterium]